MNLVDKIMSMFGKQNENMDAYQAILSWCNEQGGISGVLEKFSQGGLNEIVESWVSNGTNLPVSSEKIISVLGSPAITELAEKLGLDTLSASGLIAEYLPKIIDGLSPNGHLDEQNDLVSMGLNLLK